MAKDVGTRALRLAVVVLALAAPARGELPGLRNAVAYVRVPPGQRPVLTVSYQPVWAWQYCWEHFYVQAPDGALIARRRIEAGDPDGEVRLDLDRGPGDYRVSFSGYTYRAFALCTTPAVPMVFECAPVHMGLAQSSPKQLHFRVPAGVRSFSFCVKNHERRPIGLELLPPDGRAPIRFEGTEQFKGVKSRATIRQERDYFHNWDYDSHTVADPKPGVWAVRFARTPKVPVWTEGVPSYFATAAGDLFLPTLAPGRAEVTADAGKVQGPVGTIGASFPGPHITPLIEDRVRFLGLQSLCRYIGHSLREPTNDDADPHHIRWEGFNWAADDARSDAAARWGADLLVIIHPAKWLGGRGLLRGSDETLEEYAEFIEALLTHYNVQRRTPIRYLSLLDEPNSTYPVAQVERMLRIVAGRVRAHPDARVRATRIMAPQSSMFFKHSAGLDRRGEFYAEHLYRACDELVGGIAWDHWTYRNLFDTWLYGEAVRRAAAIQARWDSDGSPQEPIAIFQTNFFGGGGISFQDTRTFYASLWWASVVANAMKTGRMSSLNWFTTFDDPHHMKGLCYGLDKGGEIKPVGYATKMLIEALLDQAVATSSSHLELDEIATVSDDGRRMNLLVVNKLPRAMSLSARIRLPRDWRGHTCTIATLRMADGDKALQRLSERAVAVQGAVDLEQELVGESIYVFDLRR